MVRPPRRSHRSALVAIALGLGIAGCGGEGGATAPAIDRSGGTASATTTPTASGAPAALRPPPCPPESSNCERASGQIVYVERVDPDGDGDAHFVLVSDESISGPGISVIDVRADLRPSPLPGPGAMLAASGPVYEGHLGQLQIQADAVRTAPGG